jgi:hypothetical protein
LVITDIKLVWFNLNPQPTIKAMIRFTTVAALRAIRNGRQIVASLLRSRYKGTAIATVVSSSPSESSEVDILKSE